jgi:HNH endonuclease
MQPPSGAKDIPGFRGYYVEASGQVWSTRKHRYARLGVPYPMKPWRDPQGYFHVTLDIGNKRRQRIAVHVTVALAFLGPRPPGMVVAHLDGDNSNNRLENLVYVTQRENIEHKWLHGTMLCGDRSHMSRLSDKACLEILDALERGTPRRQVARAFGVSVTHVYALRSGRIRKHLTNKHLRAASAA